MAGQTMREAFPHLDREGVVPRLAAVLDLEDLSVAFVRAQGVIEDGRRVRAHIVSGSVLDGVRVGTDGVAKIEIALREDRDAAAPDVAGGHRDIDRKSTR